MRIVNGSIICSYRERFILQKKNIIYLTDTKGEILEPLFTLKRSGYKRIISKFGRLGERAARSDIRAGIVFEDTLFFSDNGDCNAYNFMNKQKVCQHKHRTGMRSPLAYSVIEDIRGFDNQVCYGEYFSNKNRETVNIWGKKYNSKEWTIVATFGAGEVRHIHGIFPDKWRNCVYVLTGDSNEESAIWIAHDNFRTMTRFISGDQQARSCQMIVNDEGFLYCTDSEYEENNLYKVQIDNNKYNREVISSFQGSIIFGASNGDNFFFSTTVEPDKGGQKSDNVIVFCIIDKGKLVELFRAKKDYLPMKLFQYGYARIVPIDNSVAISLYGVSKYDGKTVLLDYSELEQR